MANFFAFMNFEEPDDWVKKYQDRQAEFDQLLKDQKAAVEKFEAERKRLLEELTGPFSSQIELGEEQVRSAAPLCGADVAGIPVGRAAYTDRMSVLLAKMSGFAYIEFEQKDKRRILEKTLDVGTVKLVDTIVVDGTEALVAEAEKFVIVAFRGTTDKADQRIDLRIHTNRVEVEGYKHPVRVHEGFYYAFQSVRAPLEALLVKTGLTDKGPKPIYFTGHSLGGALAIVASAVFGGTKILGDRIAAVYTYGAPRVGEREFSNIVKAPHYRIVNMGDPFPLVPPNWLTGYAHSGMPLMLFQKNDKVHLIKRAPWGSASILALLSILYWPFARTLVVRKAHNLDLYASRLQKVAIERGKLT